MNKSLDHEKFIFTERLFMKPFHEMDFLNFFDLMSSDEIGRYLPMGRGMTKKECEKYFDKIKLDNEREAFGMFSIFKKEDGQYIGYCGIKKIPVIMELEIIYAIKKKYWGKGYCKEAAESVIKRGKELLGFQKILGVSKPENKKSIELLKRLEFSDLGMKEFFGIEFRYFEKIIVFEEETI